MVNELGHRVESLNLRQPAAALHSQIVGGLHREPTTSPSMGPPVGERLIWA